MRVLGNSSARFLISIRMGDWLTVKIRSNFSLILSLHQGDELFLIIQVQAPITYIFVVSLDADGRAVFESRTYSTLDKDG